MTETEKTIKELCRLRDRCAVNDWKDEARTAEKAAELLRERQWISAKDRLPMDKTHVLVAFDAVYHLGPRIKIIESAFFVDNTFEGRGYGNFVDLSKMSKLCDTVEITHWMPQPDAPKERDDD